MSINNKIYFNKVLGKYLRLKSVYDKDVYRAYFYLMVGEHVELNDYRTMKTVVGLLTKVSSSNWDKEFIFRIHPKNYRPDSYGGFQAKDLGIFWDISITTRNSV